MGQTTAAPRQGAENSRLDTGLSILFTVTGFGAALAEPGGIMMMNPGMLGAFTCGMVAVLLVAAARMPYRAQATTVLPLIVLLAALSLALGEKVLVIAGYPLLALGLSGVVLALRTPSPAPAKKPTRAPRMVSSESPALP